MKILLTQGDIGGTYELTELIGKRTARKRGYPAQSVLIQTDWDFPGVARNCRWNGKVGRERCSHRGTDGTIDCPNCKLKALDFITAAANYLNRHCGQAFIGCLDCYF